MFSDLYIVFGYKTLKSREVIGIFNNFSDALSFVNSHFGDFVRFAISSSDTTYSFEKVGFKK